MWSQLIHAVRDIGISSEFAELGHFSWTKSSGWTFAHRWDPETCSGRTGSRSSSRKPSTCIWWTASGTGRRTRTRNRRSVAPSAAWIATPTGPSPRAPLCNRNIESLTTAFHAATCPGSRFVFNNLKLPRISAAAQLKGLLTSPSSSQCWWLYMNALQAANYFVTINVCMVFWASFAWPTVNKWEW